MSKFTNKCRELRETDTMQLFSMLGPYRGKYSVCVVISGLLNSFSDVLSALSLGAAASVIEQLDSAGIRRVIVMLMGSLLLRLLSVWPASLSRQYVAGMMADIRSRTFQKVRTLPMSYYDTHLSGDLVSRVTNDISTFKVYFDDQIPSICFFILYGITTITTSLLINWQMGIVFAATSFGFKILNDYLVKAVKKLSEESYAQNAKLVQELISILSGQAIIKLFRLEDKMLDHYKEINSTYVDLSVKLSFRKGLQNACNALMTSVIGNLALIIGAGFVLGGRISVATLLVLSQLSWSVTMMFRWTGQIIGEAVSTSIAGKRILQLWEVPDEAEGFCLPEAPQVADEVRFEDVLFSYGEGAEAKTVLNGISFQAPRGRTIALVGESGGGKSTVIRLLLGFYDANKGNIWVRGKCLADYTRSQLRDLTAYVSQESYLFDATIEDNIRYGRMDASQEEIVQAAKYAYAHDFIMEQENGYQTMVGERAARLSGGQKQRIAIARAILKNAPVLLLDEATSALDAQSQEGVQKALDYLMKGRTTLVVAHRLSTIEAADEILVINHGKVTERGKHKDLLDAGGDYFKLHQLQYRNQPS